MTQAIYPDLKDDSVFITGGGSGIGAALTDGFLAQGARVAFVGRSDYRAFADALETQHGNRPLFIQCDVTDIDALHAAMDQAAMAHGPINVLVNNAADDMRYVSAEVTPEIWDAQQAINLKHYFFACQKAAAQMQNGGSIINFSSISYMMGGAGYAPYITANAGIVGMTRSLAREWGPRGIRVNAVAPGWVLTQKQLDKWASPTSLAAFLELQCLKTHIAPEDIVGPVLFLASGTSGMITSQTIVVDAGVVQTG